MGVSLEVSVLASGSVIHVLAAKVSHSGPCMPWAMWDWDQ